MSVPFERHQFPEMHQEEHKTIDQFVVPLKRKAESCDYGDQVNNQIRDQIISTCKSQELCPKLLEKGQCNDTGCYRCGKQGHFARDSNCPARNKTYNTVSVNRQDILWPCAKQRKDKTR